MTDTYKTIGKKSTGLFKDKGSKFISIAFPVSSEDEIKNYIALIKKEHFGARHHCYAWRLGAETIIFRANDDGEPSSTAGKPILGQLLSFELTNILLIVVRYFGGILLGSSGLINAYKSAAYDAVMNSEIVINKITRNFRLEFGFIHLNQVMNIIKQENLLVKQYAFETDCSLIFSVGKSDSKRIEKRFKELSGIKIDLQNLQGEL